MRRTAKFKQADVERAIRSARAAGVKVETVEIVVDGVTIRLSGERCDKAGNPWDEVLDNEQNPKIRPPLDR